MLERLSIRNVGGIGCNDLSFDTGLTVMTGESGAGKSSVVRAIELVTGKRGQASFIRAGEAEASVDAVFHTDVRLPDLEDEQQPAEGIFLVKRTLTRGGRDFRGRAVLQGVQVPVMLYSSSMRRMIHIQSQFAQMELLDAGRQLAMVDSCGGDELRASLRELREVFESARLKGREIKNITERRAEIERSYANASEVISLVKKVSLTDGLEASLENDLTALGRRIADGARIAKSFDRLTGGLSERGLLDELTNICKVFCDCLPEEASEVCARLLQDGLQNFRDFVDVVRKHAGTSTEVLSLESENLERRLGSLRKLRRLSGAKNEEELLAYCRDAEQAMEWLEKSYGLLEKASLEARELRRQASRLAMGIREARRRAAEALENRVNALLKDLAMDETDFSINFTELPKLRRDGADGVEFTLFTNRGSATERSGKVEKIASGGELSRLLLALQLSLPDEWLPPTLVFDEVEAGLGGRAAVLSGLKLKELSQRCQVILVTHEASIAALGDRHYVIRKEDGESCARGVDGEERIREIARMLSGDPDLLEAQEHARRLLQT